MKENNELRERVKGVFIDYHKDFWVSQVLELFKYESNAKDAEIERLQERIKKLEGEIEYMQKCLDKSSHEEPY